MKVHLHTEYPESKKFLSPNEAELPTSSPCSFIPADACWKLMRPLDDSALEGATKSVGCIDLACNLVLVSIHWYSNFINFVTVSNYT